MSFQELIFISDIIITDYSSLMIDSLIADKPVFLYANDIDSYVDERGFYFKFQELPFPLAKNNKELQSLIEKTNFEDVKSKYSEFKKKVQLRESGNASEKVSNMIDKICK